MNDFSLGKTIDFKFNTHQADGTPITLAGSPAVSVYEDNSTTEITAGITLTVGFDSRTGLHNVRIVASGANGYEVGKSYAAVITAGTVDSVSVVGRVIKEFTIERSAAIDEIGAAGAGLTALATQTSVNTLAGYVDTEVAAIKAKTDNLPTDPADASDIAASFSTVNSTLGTIAGYIDTEVAAIKAKTDNLPTDPADASNIATSFSTVNSTLATIAGYIDTEVAAIKAKTDNLPTDPADASDIAAAFSTVNGKLDDIQGATFNSTTDSLEAIRDRGDAAWLTGGGGSAPTVEEIRAEIDANSTVLASINTATGTTIPNNQATIIGYIDTEIAAIVSAIAALNDFDPALDTVANVTTVQTCVSNSDMRGTDSANTTAPDNAGILAAIAALNDFDPAVDVVANVTLVDTCTTNTDMRGTDGANTTAPDNATIADIAADATAIKAKTDNLPAAPAAVSDIPTALENADALLNRNIAGGSTSGRRVHEALEPLRNRHDIQSGTLTVYAEDDTTVSWQAAVTTTAGDPISQIDPT